MQHLEEKQSLSTEAKVQWALLLVRYEHGCDATGMVEAQQGVYNCAGALTMSLKGMDLKFGSWKSVRSPCGRLLDSQMACPIVLRELQKNGIEELAYGVLVPTYTCVSGKEMS